MVTILSVDPWSRSFPVNEQVLFGKEAGFDGIDYIATLSEVLTSRERINALSKKYKMPVLGVHYPLFLIPFTPTLLLSKLLRYISFFPECRVYNFHLSGFMHLLNRKGSGAQKFMKLASNKNVVISFESNPAQNIIVRAYPRATYDPKHFAEYCLENKLSITFDTSHIAYQGYDVVEFYKKYHQAIKLIHLSDYKDKKQHLFLGKGTLPLRELFEEMKRTRYNEVVSFELNLSRRASSNESLKAVQESLRFFKEYAS